MHRRRRALGLRAAAALVTTGLGACGDSGDSLTRLSFAVEATAAIDFGVVGVGQRGVATVTVRATGTGPVALLGAHSPDPAIAFEGLPAEGLVVDGRGARDVEVAWRPALEGTLEARLRLFTDVRETPTLWVEARGEAVPQPECDDGNSCTDDRFDTAAQACRSAPRAGACDDGSACTTPDRCLDGTCVGEAVACDDATACTADGCDPERGCVYTPARGGCDDGDPCTVDTCSSGSGCSFPRAPDGTPCGLISCAEVHFCFLGACVAASGLDGFPCDDGDACTAGDTCLGGVCNPGLQARAAPGVLEVWDTFGGAGSTGASDGDLYVFTQADGLRLAALDPAGSLQPGASLAFPAPLRPLAAAPGRFLLVGAAGELAALDATDPADPVLTWEAALIDPAPPPAPPVPPTVEVAAATLGGVGLVVAVRFTYRDGTGSVIAVSAGVDLLPIADVAATPGPGQRLATTTEPVTSLAAVSDQVAWASGGAVRWLRLDAGGAVLAGFTAPFGGPLALGDGRLAVLDGAQVWILEPDAGAPEGWSPWASATFFSGTAGVWLDPGWVLLARDRPPLGLFALPAAPGLDQRPPITVVDRMPARGLAGEPAHLWLTGDLALPLRREAAAPAVRRVTGPLHGDVVAALTGVRQGLRNEVVVAGATAVGIFDVNRRAMVAWTQRWGSAAQTPPWVVLGAGGGALVGGAPRAPPWVWSDACTGYAVEAFDAGGAGVTTVACGLLAAEITAVSGGRLWAVVPGAPGALRAWPLGSAGSGSADSGAAGLQDPVIDAPGLVGDGGPPSFARLRAADAGDWLATLEVLAATSQVQVSVMPSGAAALAAPRLAVLPCLEVGCAGDTDPGRWAISADAVLRAGSGSVTLHALEPAPLAAPPLAAAAAGASAPAFVCWPSARAWVGRAAATLEQLEVGAAEVRSLGEAALPRAPLSAADAGTAVVAVTGDHVVLIAPACTP